MHVVTEEPGNLINFKSQFAQKIEEAQAPKNTETTPEEGPTVPTRKRIELPKGVRYQNFEYTMDSKLPTKVIPRFSGKDTESV